MTEHKKLKMTMIDFDIMYEQGRVFSHIARGGLTVEYRDLTKDEVFDRVYWTDAQSLRTYHVQVRSPHPSDEFVYMLYTIGCPVGMLHGWADYEEYQDAFWAMKDRGDMDEVDAALDVPTSTSCSNSPETPAEADEEYPGPPDLETEPPERTAAPEPNA